MDCIFQTIAYKMSRLPYNIIALANGVSNTIRETNYADEKVRTLDGRGFLHSLTIYDQLGITYEKIDVDDFFQLSSFDDIIVFTSKERLVFPDRIKPNIRQLILYVSSFYCESITSENAALRLCCVDDQYDLPIDLAHKMSGLESFPEHPAIYIIRILDRNYKPSRKKIINNTLKKLTDCMVNATVKNEKYICYSGPQFYQKFIEIIEEFANIGPNKTTKDTIEQQLFIGTLNGGGRGFYRQDFYESLGYLKEWYHIDLEIETNQLRLCNCAWIEIGKILRRHQSKTGYVNENSLNQIRNAMSVIQENELSAISRIIEKIKKGFD
jgi:hypothetical protein